jgi:hypothetical protein
MPVTYLISHEHCRICASARSCGAARLIVIISVQEVASLPMQQQPLPEPAIVDVAITYDHLAVDSAVV